MFLFEESYEVDKWMSVTGKLEKIGDCQPFLVRRVTYSNGTEFPQLDESKKGLQVQLENVTWLVKSFPVFHVTKILVTASTTSLNLDRILAHLNPVHIFTTYFI
jgi:hypothetical protein